MKKLSIIIVFFSLINGCSKETSNETFGTLRDYTGLDGCRWVIEVGTGGDNLKRLEPINLESFSIVKKDGLRIAFTYHPTNNVSICMVGTTVKLSHLRKI